MKINKISMAIIAAASLLAVSPTVYAQTTNSTGGAAAPGGRARGGRGPTLETIDKAVTLTDAEKPKVKTALEELATAVTAARAADQADRQTQMTAARADFTKKMKDILTPEQFTKFQAMPQPGRRGAGGGAGGAGGGAPPAAN